MVVLRSLVEVVKEEINNIQGAELVGSSKYLSEPTPSQSVTESGEGIVEVPPIAIQVAPVQQDTGKGEGTIEVSTNNVVEEVKKEVAKEVVKEEVLIDKAQEEAPILQKEAPIVQKEAPIVQKEAPIVQNEAPIVQNTSAEPTTNGIWQQREVELLKKIQELESVRSEASDDGIKLELKQKDEEIEILRARVKSLESELHTALNKPGGKNQEVIDNIKQQHEELLSKARGMIFDKTKVVKNQELQIEALTTQVQSLKDINTITKDLLEIRNAEVKAMEERLAAMEARFKAERDRHELLLKRAEATNTLNADLKKEYETQLGLFKELRVKYDERLQVLVTENNRLKESMRSEAS